MANHVRKQLRDAVVARVTGLTTTGSRVHGYRVHPLQSSSKLPALSVYATSEAAEADTIHAPTLVDRFVDLHVEGIANASDATLEDTLDQISKEVETALASALTIGSKEVLLVYQGCEIRMEDGEKRAGVVDMAFRARIFNAANTPDVLS